MFTCSLHTRSDTVQPTIPQLLPWIKKQHVEACFHRAFSVIDHDYLDCTPAGSSTGSVRSTLTNLIACAVSFHFEVNNRMLTKEEAADMIYDLDKLTDSDHWVLPLDRLAGPAGARRPKRKARITQKRMLKFIKEDGTAVDVEVGDN